MAFIFCQPEIYRNELYQDKIFMQGVRPIGANNKIFLSEQAPTEYFIIHSCMSHSNSKIVAISTVKHLSWNYASFSNRVCKSGIAYPLLVRHKAFYKGTPLTFMEMDISCRTQDTKQKKSPSWCVMLTLSKKGCKLNFYFGANFLFELLKMSRIGFMPKTKNRRKTVIMHNFTIRAYKTSFSCPCESLCRPCVRF